MKRVLLTFVGEQDPYSDKTNSEGAIVTLTRAVSPDLIFMLPSKRLPGLKSETESNAELVKDWLKEFGIFNKENIYIHPLSVTDPRKIPELLEQGSIEIRRILENLGKVELVINTSSGTPQMQSCWYIWVNSGLFTPCQVTLYQVGNPQYISDDKRVDTITVEFMEEGNTVERIKKYLETRVYLSAAEEAVRLSQISCYFNRRAKADIIARICNAYHNWDLLNYRETLTILRSILARCENSIDMGNLTGLLKKQVDTLIQLNAAQADEISVLTDIYYNAERRFHQNAYADTLARIWRLIEGCLYYRLRSKHGIEPRDLSLSKNTDNMKKVKDNVQAYKELSFARSVAALKNALSDNGYITFEKKEVALSWGEGIRKKKIGAAMEDIRSIRNDSIVAHGITPVYREVAQQSLGIGKLFLEFTFKNADYALTYPFQGDESRNILIELL